MRSGKEITLEYLKQFPSFQEFIRGNKEETINGFEQREENVDDQTPLDKIASAIEQQNASLANNLKEEIIKMDPSKFEELVLKLLKKMGVGYTTENTKKTRDGGVDGVVSVDYFGFDKIYIQAKRLQPTETISAPVVQSFVGALAEKGASKGIFITTAMFTDPAKNTARNVAPNQRIILIDGEKLINLMIEFGIGTFTVATYEVKEIDSDFFIEQE